MRNLEEQIQKLQQENTSYEQSLLDDFLFDSIFYLGNKDLQRYLDTSIKEQMKAYEDRIKVFQEFLMKYLF